ncbi:MAG: TonB-dependent receptor [Bacteroidetes bacterium]|nr:TonB-dependent receptor [Bacteroidota bacterium]
MFLKNLLLLWLCVFSVNLFGQDTLKNVQIEASRKSLKKSLHLTQNTTVMSSKELLKAACCNLAESFETNPAIDVNFADALTGTKQIKMLGLTSPYLLITQENIPSVRGASQAYGLSFVPGTWVESIQVTKGAGSVVNGYESISGQINTELIKPLKDIPLLINVYGSSDARFELNTHFNHQFSEKWASSLYVHGNMRQVKKDMNDDGFLDNPLSKQVNLINRWQYANAQTGWVAFITGQYMRDNKLAGQVNFDRTKDVGSTRSWGSEINTERIDLATKVGYVFKDMPFQSIGFQNAFSHHNQRSYFGLNNYNIRQRSYYSNLIFNSIINNTKHKFATGLNLTADVYDEFWQTTDWSRTDNSAGVFFEYTYDNADNLSFVLGGRFDYHNRLGAFVTPRLHVKYIPWEKAALRLSAGRGKRAANIFAENQNLMASNRTFSIANDHGKIYGLDPEIAWNYGVSFSQSFFLWGKSADVNFDFYRTDFVNQAVVDLYQNPQQVLIYNLSGASYANSFQLDFNLELKKHLDLRTAYKYYDIQTDYLSGKQARPLQAKHRFFVNLAYATQMNNKGRQWKFDATLNWLGPQRLPYTGSNPPSEQLPVQANGFSTLNAQITRVFSSAFEVYVGGENMANYQQERAVLGAQNPFGNYFDASMIYAPVFGQMYYAGLRYKIK